jgi:UDP-glucose 4-epimerase
MDSPFPEDVLYNKVDITRKEEVANVMEDAQSVIHLAASPLTKSLEDPILDMSVNVGGTLNIMERSREEKVNLIIYSSASSVVGTLQHNPVDENHPCVPRTTYAASKLACEHYLRVYQEIYGLNYLVFRFFNIYGPWQYPTSGGLIPSIINRVLNKEDIKIFGDGSATRDFVYVEDLVHQYKSAIEGKAINELLNLGTGSGTSIMEVVETVGDVLDIEPNIQYEPKRDGEIDNFYADTAKLERTFGFKPSTSLREGVEKTCQWFLDENI